MISFLNVCEVLGPNRDDSITNILKFGLPEVVLAKALWHLIVFRMRCYTKFFTDFLLKAHDMRITVLSFSTFNSFQNAFGMMCPFAQSLPVYLSKEGKSCCQKKRKNAMQRKKC